MTRLLFLGDIVGSTGQQAVMRALPRLVRRYSPQYMCANIENCADGFGVTYEEAAFIVNLGIHACTTGNHVFDRPGYEALFDGSLPIIRPANWPGTMPGKGHILIPVNGKRLLVMNVLGRTFMTPSADDPFAAIDAMLALYNGRYDVSVLDIHAETTSEKRAIAEYFDGRIQVIVGTHTHVQTNDARTLPKGTGFLTDLGMCGPERSIIGFDIAAYTRRLRTGVHEYTAVPEGRCEVSGCIADIHNDSTHMRTFRLTVP